LVKDAQRKQEMYDKTLSMLQENKNPFDIFLDENRKQNADKEQSLKSFYKEFKKVVEAADVIIEVLDARDPIGSRCLQVEEMIISSGTNKKLVLLLNKIDLVPKENTQAWLKYLRNQYPTVAFKSSTQNQNEKLVSHKFNKITQTSFKSGYLYK
jgi:nuclear GTP-binding protein